MDPEEDVDGGNSRSLQDFLDAAAAVRPSRGAAEASEDDDMSYQPTTEDDTEDEMHEFFGNMIEGEETEGGDEEDEEDDGEDEEFFDVVDAEGNHHTIQIEMGGGETETGGTTGPANDDMLAATQARRERILRLLASSQLGRLFFQSADDNDDDFAEGAYFRRRRARTRPDPDRFPKIPSDTGTELMNSGEFGLNEIHSTSTINKRKRLATRVLYRELGLDGGAQQKANQRLMAQGMLPASTADMIIHYDAPVYSGQFSDDGNFFFACVKDFKVRMYDTSNPYRWRYYKTVDYPWGQWTLTDATLSPDNKYLAYTSMRPEVCLAPTDPNDLGDPYVLDLSDGGRIGRGTGHYRRRDSFAIFGLRFSGDGRELVAGTSSNSIVVYDIESRQVLHNIFGHEDEINAVCFGDKSSPHILYSGSDDTTLKVWDRRSMGDSRAAGAFVGHTEGLTYIDSKGDGRYILSNGKDQSMKLWDLRMVMPTSAFSKINPQQYSTGFDYRYGVYDEDDWQPHPMDNSVVTFRGHKVLRTLIRCHFSPPGSTNSRYVYSGSEDGRVYVYNMDASLAGKVDVQAATRDSRPHYRGEMMAFDDDYRQSNWRTCIRDASWHPNAPVIAASSWNGYGMSSGTVTVHSWNDGAEDDEAEPKMGVRVDDRLAHDPALYSRTSSGRATRATRARPVLDDDE